MGLCLAVLMAATPLAEVFAQESGLPLPRYVSLRAEEVNMRTGPGMQYPIEWVYRRRGLPVEVINEHDTWRKIRDWQGAQGWVHQSMITGKRSVQVLGSERTLRERADVMSPAMAYVEPDVIGAVLECPDGSTWCRIRFDRHVGWLRRVEVFGVYDGEVVR